MVKKKGFTLIELVAVLVIMAILALIVTPLVMSIIRKAKISADKRSIDAYGRSIELAIAGYLLDNGRFPTSIEQLTIEYSGNEVVCSTTQLNSDSSVYLTGCRVAGRIVDYTYGSDKQPKTYSVGDEVSYNGVDYYVIANSGANESTVTLLKAEPLTVAEVNTYGGVGTVNNHVNMYAYNSDSDHSYYQTAADVNGYGGIQYYSSSTCGYVGKKWVYDGCTTSYALSEIKYVVDAWKTAKAPAATEARLITFDELTSFGYVEVIQPWGKTYPANNNVPTWLYNNYYSYYTMSVYEDTKRMWVVSSDNGRLNYGNINNNYVVRPVIVLSKSVL